MAYHRVTKEFLESMDYKVLGEFIQDRFSELEKYWNKIRGQGPHLETTVNERGK